MEDRHIVVPALGGHAHAHLFAVFDGHRGHEAAEFAMSHVERAVRSEWGRARRRRGKSAHGGDDEIRRRVSRAFRRHQSERDERVEKRATRE